jgi:chaperone BCS1
MDFSSLLNLDLNSTSDAILASPPSVLLNHAIPGCGIISQLLLRSLGFDIGMILPGLMFIYGLGYSGHKLYNHLYEYVFAYFISSIHIEDNDYMYDTIMDWVAKRQMTKVSRDLKAVTKWTSIYNDNDGDSDDEDQPDNDDVLDDRGIFNFESGPAMVHLASSLTTEPIRSGMRVATLYYPAATRRPATAGATSRRQSTWSSGT